jgi:hypothetical protein
MGVMQGKLFWQAFFRFYLGFLCSFFQRGEMGKNGDMSS